MADGNANLEALNTVPLIINPSSWIINNNQHYNLIFKSYTDLLEGREESHSSGERYWIITTSGIPNYEKVLTDKDINYISHNNEIVINRNKLNIDGNTLGSKGPVSLGNVNTKSSVEFGSDIGFHYDSPSPCMGYWPEYNDLSGDSNACPVPANDPKYQTIRFPVHPTPAQTQNHIMDGIIGYSVNGIPLYSFSKSYPIQDGIWNELAWEAFSDRLDVCQGYAPSISSDSSNSDSESNNNSQYRHFMWSSCLRDVLKDDSSKHSPIYGFALDGYPIYGPYQQSNRLTVSCWQKRDYISLFSETGCRDNQDRACILVDPFHPEQGTRRVDPPRDRSDLKKEYYEDYFYNSSCSLLSDNHLNEYNGHSHEGYGFHYHMTINDNEDPVFPYIIGPRLFGTVVTTNPHINHISSSSIRPFASRNSSRNSSDSNGLTSNNLFLLVGILILVPALVLALNVTYHIRKIRRRLFRQSSISDLFDGNGGIALVPIDIAQSLPAAEVSITRQDHSHSIEVSNDMIRVITDMQRTSRRGSGAMKAGSISATRTYNESFCEGATDITGLSLSYDGVGSLPSTSPVSQHRSSARSLSSYNETVHRTPRRVSVESFFDSDRDIESLVNYNMDMERGEQMSFEQSPSIDCNNQTMGDLDGIGDGDGVVDRDAGEGDQVYLDEDDGWMSRDDLDTFSSVHAVPVRPNV